MRGGYLTVFPGGSFSIRVHWTAPLGAFVMGQFQIVPGFWLGFLVLILMHEIGHAVAVKIAGCDVESLLVDGAGGQCSYTGQTNARWRSIIAWGGIVVQLLLYAGVRTWLALAEPELGQFAAEFVNAFLWINLILVAFNLIPVRGMDGVEAWKLFPILWRAHKRKKAERLAAKLREGRDRARREITQLDGLDGESEPSDPEVEDVVKKLLERTTGKNGKDKEPR